MVALIMEEYCAPSLKSDDCQTTFPVSASSAAIAPFAPPGVQIMCPLS